ncbi:hypothetical protein [Dactylosporangium sp. NPDC048998]|uniref:hypothetical protein n=1 Tax=Dactylosporangium sp. NPDC048998 TaxID=3363976 RepID=UPI003710EAD9
MQVVVPVRHPRAAADVSPACRSLAVTLHADHDAMPDLDRLADAIPTALAALTDAIYRAS